VGGSQLGITVDTLSPQLAEYFGTKEGVLVTSVNDNSAANKAGLKAGDVITSLNGGSVNAPADLRRRAQRLEGGDEFTLSVVRDRKPLSLKGKVEAPQPRRLMNRTIL
jgi:S1-C subfamily serine protease